MYIRTLVSKITHSVYTLRDKNNKEKYFGNDELWEKSENEFT